MSTEFFSNGVFIYAQKEFINNQFLSGSIYNAFQDFQDKALIWDENISK